MIDTENKVKDNGTWDPITSIDIEKMIRKKGLKVYDKVKKMYPNYEIKEISLSIETGVFGTIYLVTRVRDKNGDVKHRLTLKDADIYSE